ncbi:hypothetical protein RchiOBHm_Chr3g0479211 [Rosa chinensis]|uniref:Uncharacterized protein n=1 Tax=Rosa chinensis TaxID=74649 RepID=A0A2P6RDD7_ROSCH|nr:hypothetical protein RchiOBHm_Chr3g0479211 [Rosa chinensis]
MGLLASAFRPKEAVASAKSWAKVDLPNAHMCGAYKQGSKKAPPKRTLSHANQNPSIWRSMLPLHALSAFNLDQFGVGVGVVKGFSCNCVHFLLRGKKSLLI